MKTFTALLLAAVLANPLSGLADELDHPTRPILDRLLEGVDTTLPQVQVRFTSRVRLVNKRGDDINLISGEVITVSPKIGKRF